MRILDRYILREMFVPFLIGQAAITLMLVGTVLYNNASILLMYQVPVLLVLRMVLYFIPFLIHMTMPVAMAVAASLAVSRLGRDSEITVMRASGISLRRIFRPIMLLGLLVSIGDFYFGEYAVPPAVQRLNQVLGEIPLHIKRLVPQAGQWVSSVDQSYTVMVQQLVPKKGYIELHDVIVVAGPGAAADNKQKQIVFYAKQGRYEGSEWVLDHPKLMYYGLDSGEHSETNPDRARLRFVVDPQAFQSGLLLQFPMWQMGQQTAHLSFTELGAILKRNREQGIKNNPLLLDYNFKLSVPFSCLVMALCCPPLSQRFARGGGFMGTLLSIGLVFVYWNTMLLMRILGSEGPDGNAPLLSPIVAAWSQNVIFALMGWWVLRRSE